MPGFNPWTNPAPTPAPISGYHPPSIGAGINAAQYGQITTPAMGSHMAQLNAPAQPGFSPVGGGSAPWYGSNAPVGAGGSPNLTGPGIGGYVPWGRGPGFPTGPGAQAPVSPSYGGGGGGGPAAPAVDPNWNPPPRGGSSEWFFMPDGGGPSAQNPAGGHWVHNEHLPPVAPPPVAPPAGAPGTVPPAMPTTFYAPSTQSPYLSLQDNWLSMVDPTMRAQLNQQLQGMHFQPTGDVGRYGEQMYLRPQQFNNEDLNAVTDPALRQWMRFFLGNLGYGISYQLPGVYSGTGMPPAPPNPQAPPPSSIGEGASHIGY